MGLNVAGLQTATLGFSPVEGVGKATQRWTIWYIQSEIMTQLKKMTLIGLGCLLPLLVQADQTLEQVDAAAAAKAELIEQQLLMIEIQMAEDDGAGVIPPSLITTEDDGAGIIPPN